MNSLKHLYEPLTGCPPPADPDTNRTADRFDYNMQAKDPFLSELTDYVDFRDDPYLILHFFILLKIVIKGTLSWIIQTDIKQTILMLSKSQTKQSNSVSNQLSV